MNTTWQRTIGLLAVLAATLTACSAAPDSSSTDPQRTPTSTGTATPAVDTPTGDPITLRLGTGDAKNSPSASQIRWFAKRVDELSHGQIRIKPVYLAAGHVARFEPVMVKQAIDGDLDLTVAATRVWDTVGVRTLAPLQAPFVVTSDEAMAQVVADPIEEDLLSGLPEVGVVGLGLWPEGLRHPFGFGEPLNEPGDYQGALLRAPYSNATKQMFRALGARTTNGAPDPTTQRGAESQYSSAPAGTATANVVFFPKINALVANAEVDAALTDEQREALMQAADDTRDWVLETMPTDNEAARTFCKEGGHIQSAGPEQVEAMVRTTQPVVDVMRQDEQLGPIIAEIETMAGAIDAEEPLSDCGDETDAEATAQLNGEYTFTVSPTAARQAGVTSKEVIEAATGRFTVTMQDGIWMLGQTYATGPSKGRSDTGQGDYTIKGNRLTWYWSHEPGGWVKVAFSVKKDGSVTFDDVTDGEGPEWELMAQVHFSHWKRTGDGS